MELDETNSQLQALQNTRYIMNKKADELRQSSDDLTRFARTYVVTGNEQYKDKYFTTLGIRNGKIGRPFEYDGVYWDLLEPTRSIRHPIQEAVSLSSQMNRLPYSDFEFSKLKESHSYSDNLVKLEVQAFNAMQGKFLDKDNKYTITKEPNQALAISLLHSKQYHLVKQLIMLPIDKFLSSLSNRMQEKSIELQKKVEKLSQKIFILISLDITLFLLTIYMIVKKVLAPISAVTKMIQYFKEHKKIMEKPVFNKDEIGLMVKKFYSMQKQVEQDHYKLQKLANTDELTGLYNRRYFLEYAEKALKQSNKIKNDFSLCIFDIDNFKEINDSYGQHIGDNVLQHVIQLILKQLRQNDILSRYSGDQFIILYQDTPLELVHQLSQDLCQLIHNNDYIFDKHVQLKISISIGIHEYKHKSLLLSELIKNADTALLKAKSNGKNQVVIF